MLAALGQREQPGEMTAEDKTQARRQARGVWTRSISVGVVTTAIVWFVERTMR